MNCLLFAGRERARKVFGRLKPVWYDYADHFQFNLRHLFILTQFRRWAFYWLVSRVWKQISFIFIRFPANWAILNENFTRKFHILLLVLSGEGRKFVHIVAESIENLKKKKVFNLKRWSGWLWLEWENFSENFFWPTRTKWLYFDFRCLLKMIASKSIWKFTFTDFLNVLFFSSLLQTTCFKFRRIYCSAVLFI